MEQFKMFKKRIQLLNTILGSMNTRDKKDIIVKLLEDGVDINETYCDYKHNTLLHLATIERDKDIVEFLLNMGAGIYRNNEGKTFLDIETEYNAADTHEDPLASEATSTDSNRQTNAKTSESIANGATGLPGALCRKGHDVKLKLTYKKESGTAGIAGQLYETKLLSLILFRALHDRDVEEFYLATNICGVGPFDDICLRFKIKGHAKPFAVFMQAKHKNNTKRGITADDLSNPNSDFYLKKYFESYLKIKEKFNPESKEVIFRGNFDEVTCVFILYTSATLKFGNANLKHNVPYKNILSLISAGKDGKVVQMQHEYLMIAKSPVESEAKSAGGKMLKPINSKPSATLCPNLKENNQISDMETLNANSSGHEYDSNETLPVDPLEAEFFSKLLFFTSQAKENEIEKILKEDIDKQFDTDERRDEEMFRVHSDAVFLDFHNYVQKWWMLQNKAYYLGNDCDFYKKARNNAIVNPLLCVLNFTFINKLKKNDIEFSNEAVRTLKLYPFTPGVLNVVTDGMMFTSIKLTQYFSNMNNQIFIDFDYVLTLPINYYNTLLAELRKTKMDIFIISYKGEITDSYEKLSEIVSEFVKKTIIIISDEATSIEIQELTHCLFCVRDETIGFINLTPMSQSKILSGTKIIYQGEEKLLGEVIDDGSKHLIKSNTLLRLVKNDRIEIGRGFINQDYHAKNKCNGEICLRRGEETFEVKTLHDLDDGVVTVIGDPDKGKATLLTYLSLETKKKYPKTWISRINLHDYSNIFFDWQQNDTEIGVKEALEFICSATVNRVQGYKDKGSQAKVILEEVTGEFSLQGYNEIPDSALLEIELFIHFYNRGDVIFLFDKLHKACRYEKEVITFFKSLTTRNSSGILPDSTSSKRMDVKNRIWVTSKPVDYVINIMTREFTPPYTMEPLS